MAALVLAVHGLAALMLLASRDERGQRPPPPRELEGVWITLDLRAPPPGEPRALPPPPPPPSPPPPPREVALVQPRPRTAITLPPPAEPATPPQDDASTRPIEPVQRGPADWYAQAKKLVENDPGDEPATFSPPPEVMRKCTPRVTSFWGKPPEPREEAPQWDRGARPPPGSVMMGGTRVGTIGLGIPLGGPKPEPNKHLFDDMMAGKTPESSVPSPHICD